MKMKTVPLADVLWTAANEHLHHERHMSASCCCVYAAQFGHSWGLVHDTWKAAVRQSSAVRFLRALGCPVGSNEAFKRYRVADLQGARYMWLLLAMHVAADEKIMVEVPA